MILAARIADQAEGGEILVSSLVRELTGSVGDIDFDAPRRAELKGLGHDYRLSPVRWRQEGQVLDMPRLATAS